MFFLVVIFFAPQERYDTENRADGVMIEQTLEPTSDKAVAFTAVNRSGETIWGYKEQSASGICTIETSAERNDDAIYDLQGRRVTTPQRKGIYIRNGKKYFVR